MRRIKSKIFLSLVLPIFLLSCRENNVPKPRGYFRIDLPEKSYVLYDTLCPFTFEFPVYSKINYDVGKKTEPCWFNIEIPRFSANIHISYKQLSKDLAAYLDETHEFAYSHSIKADAISEQPWVNKEQKVYGTIYDIKGNTASSVQFYLTDSTRNFLRGALYFNVTPDQDSLAPVIDFFRQDIVHLIETFRWKNK